MKCDKLFETIDSLYDTYLKVWEDVCNIESPTHLKNKVDEVGVYFAKMAGEHGWKVEYFNHNVSGDVVCITMNPESKNAPVSLSGHMDTVHPVGLFGYPAVRHDNEKIYGPGVTDCKGGIVAGFMAMDALDRCGFKDRPVMLLLQSDEEGSSIGSEKKTIGYICEKAKNSIAFLNLEGTTKGEACVQRKGIVTFKFEINGIAAHASKCATNGASAILEAAHKIIELEKLKDAEGLTCSCGIVNGGTAVNTVPAYCEFVANVRFATNVQLEWVRDYVRKIAENNTVKGCSCTVTENSFRVAMERCERNLALLDTMNKIFAENGMPTLKPSKRTGGSDAADVTVYGIPCIDSIGVAGGNIHTIDEYAYLDSLPEATKRIAAVVYSI